MKDKWKLLGKLYGLKVVLESELKFKPTERWPGGGFDNTYGHSLTPAGDEIGIHLLKLSDKLRELVKDGHMGMIDGDYLIIAKEFE